MSKRWCRGDIISVKGEKYRLHGTPWPCTNDDCEDLDCQEWLAYPDGEEPSPANHIHLNECEMEDAE